MDAVGMAYLVEYVEDQQQCSVQATFEKGTWTVLFKSSIHASAFKQELKDNGIDVTLLNLNSSLSQVQ